MIITEINLFQVWDVVLTEFQTALTINFLFLRYNLHRYVLLLDPGSIFNLMSKNSINT